MKKIVPEKYLGLWHRTLLESPDGTDTSTQVFWLQTSIWHADIRIPATRPDFTGVYDLATCSEQHLDWLLRQEGFVGVTVVDKDVCEWQRRVDYRPNPYRDIARMQFCEDYLDEFGIVQPYRERWMRIPLDTRQLKAQQSRREGEIEYLLQAGEYFIYLRPRPYPHEEVVKLWDLFNHGLANLNDKRRLADLEISFGVVRDCEFHIQHSTLPWKAGSGLPQISDWLTLED